MRLLFAITARLHMSTSHNLNTNFSVYLSQLLQSSQLNPKTAFFASAEIKLDYSGCVVIVVGLFLDCLTRASAFARSSIALAPIMCAARFACRRFWRGAMADETSAPEANGRKSAQQLLLWQCLHLVTHPCE